MKLVMLSYYGEICFVYICEKNLNVNLGLHIYIYGSLKRDPTYMSVMDSEIRS
jgi:hypothetical protein